MSAHPSSGSRHSAGWMRPSPWTTAGSAHASLSHLSRATNRYVIQSGSQSSSCRPRRDPGGRLFLLQGPWHKSEVSYTASRARPPCVLGERSFPKTTIHIKWRSDSRLVGWAAYGSFYQPGDWTGGRRKHRDVDGEQRATQFLVGIARGSHLVDCSCLRGDAIQKSPWGKRGGDLPERRFGLISEQTIWS